LLRTKYQCEEIGKVVIACFFRLAVVSMAGLAAEGLTYDKVVGQSADLFTLQVWDLYFQNTLIIIKLLASIIESNNNFKKYIFCYRGL